MTPTAPAVHARARIGQLFVARRLVARRAVMSLLLHAVPQGPAAREAAMTRVHELCAAELEQRVRIAARQLHEAYLAGDGSTRDRLLAELRLELEAVLREETSALAEDERFAASFLEGLAEA